MSAVSRILRKGSDGYIFWCPGCDGAHQVFVDSRGRRPGAQWSFNGNVEAPTFTPSLAVWWTEPSGEKRCHSIIIDGRIQFQADCTHALANQTVPIPPFPFTDEEWSDG